MSRYTTTLAATALSALLVATAYAQDPMPSAESLQNAFPERENYSPYANRNFPTQVFWGDTHLHTGMSLDAGAFGATLTPDDAYRFRPPVSASSCHDRSIFSSSPTTPTIWAFSRAL
jgi:hypothetical protein